MGAPYIYDVSRLRVKNLSFLSTWCHYTFVHFKYSVRLLSLCN